MSNKTPEYYADIVVEGMKLSSEQRLSKYSEDWLRRVALAAIKDAMEAALQEPNKLTQIATLAIEYAGIQQKFSDYCNNDRKTLCHDTINQFISATDVAQDRLVSAVEEYKKTS